MSHRYSRPIWAILLTVTAMTTMSACDAGDLEFWTWFGSADSDHSNPSPGEGEGEGQTACIGSGDITCCSDAVEDPCWLYFTDAAVCTERLRRLLAQGKTEADMSQGCWDVLHPAAEGEGEGEGEGVPSWPTCQAVLPPPAGCHPPDEGEGEGEGTAEGEGEGATCPQGQWDCQIKDNPAQHCFLVPNPEKSAEYNTCWVDCHLDSDPSQTSSGGYFEDYFGPHSNEGVCQAVENV